MFSSAHTGAARCVMRQGGRERELIIEGVNECTCDIYISWPHIYLYIWRCSAKWGIDKYCSTHTGACNGGFLIWDAGVSMSSPVIWSASCWVFITGSVPDLSLKRRQPWRAAQRRRNSSQSPLPATAATSWWQHCSCIFIAATAESTLM